MDPFLTSALAAIDQAAGDLPADVIGRPVEGRWSIAGILEHLTLSFTLNRAAFEKALASGEVRARAPRLGQRIGRLLVVDLGYVPRREAPEATAPRGSIPPGKSVAAIREALTALDATMTRVVERFGADVAVANHPYFAGMTVRQWRKFHWRHTVHHMRHVRARQPRG
jgi:hypothetical protein